MTSAHVIIIIVALAGCIWDLRTRRIPNYLTFGAAALGLSRALRGHPWWALRASASPRFVIRGSRGDVAQAWGISQTSVGSVPRCVVINVGVRRRND